MRVFVFRSGREPDPKQGEARGDQVEAEDREAGSEEDRAEKAPERRRRVGRQGGRVVVSGVWWCVVWWRAVFWVCFHPWHAHISPLVT